MKSVILAMLALAVAHMPVATEEPAPVVGTVTEAPRTVTPIAAVVESVEASVEVTSSVEATPTMSFESWEEYVAWALTQPAP